jgi:hypothetical protein
MIIYSFKKCLLGLCMKAHIYNPSYLGRSWFKASLGKISETLSQNLSQASWFTSVIPAGPEQKRLAQWLKW